MITGASSIIGEACTRILLSETNHKLILLSSNAESISEEVNTKKHLVSGLDKQLTKKICLDERPHVIINTIGMNSPEECEKDKRTAWELNANVIENLARMAKIIEAHLIVFSSEYVFDGRKGPYSEDDRPNPQNYLGKSKLAGENYARTGCDKFTIIRHTPLYGYSSFGREDFISRLTKGFQSEEYKLGYAKTMTNPVYADDIAIMSLRVIEKERYGIYHAGGESYESIEWFHKKYSEVFNPAKDNDIEMPKPGIITQVSMLGLVSLKSTTDLGIKFSSWENGIKSVKFRYDKY